MPWIDIALVTVTVGTALIMVSPLARLMGIYSPTEMVKSGFILGMYGTPTWRFWALSSFFFAMHSAWTFEKEHFVMGAAWAVMTPAYLIFTLQAARRPRAEPETTEAAESGESETA